MAQPVLFLHGWTMQGAIFDDAITRLGPDYDCAAPDLPGHGSAAHQPATLDACAEMIADTLGRWQGTNPLVVGWSMGAAAAWHYIGRYGCSGIGALMTLDMSPRIRPAPDWPHGLIGQTASSIAATTERLVADWDGATQGIAATMFAAPDGTAGLSRTQARDLILTQDREQMHRLWRDLVAMDERPVIDRIDCPYLVCSGAKSRVYPASAADWIAQHAPDARRHVFENSGHSPHLEEPDAFARIVRDFTASAIA
ncbi:alpha/beta fold hydrolase [Marivita sp. S2033]|uniref:alpha/beta fold hydrolase n=1 Tax=Marivita sp. S2033 TaxID=3373187 RepID=UPI003981A8CE